MRNANCFPDFSKGKLVPDFHHQHLALLTRQTFNRSGQFPLRIIQLLKLRWHRVVSLAGRFQFAAHAPAVTPDEIERGRAHGGVKEPAIAQGKIPAPKAHESFLDHVFGIGRTAHPLPGEKEKTGSEFRKTDFPIFMSGDILHDPSRSLNLKRRQLLILSTAAGFFSLAAISLVSESASAQSPDVAAARDIARLDREFSDSSVQKGMPAACVAYFADDGIAFAPTAVNGKKYWASRTNWDNTLVWQPIFAAVARAGDLGFTTGPWELKKKVGSSLAFGHYVTVWRKEPNGPWKVALDVGTDNRQPSEPPPPLQVLPADAVTTESSSREARRALKKTYRDFVAAGNNEIGKALIGVAADAIRVYRENAAPAIGTAAAQVILGSEHGKEMRSEDHVTLSKSGDLAYTYGNYSEERGNITERGIYLTIWRTNLNSDWQLVLDLKKKLPSDKT